jgi:hypothetical protein
LGHNDANTTYFSVGYETRRMTSIEKAKFDEWYFLSKAVGSYSNDSVGRVPISPSHFASTLLEFQGVARFVGGACLEAFERRDQVERAFKNSLSSLTGNYDPPSPDLLQASEAFFERLKACEADNTFAANFNLSGHFFQYNSRIFNSEEVIEKILGIGAFDKPNVPHITVFREALERAHLRIRELSEELNFADLRVYTVEDQADELAIQALKGLRSDDPTTPAFDAAAAEEASFGILLLGLDRDADRETCRRQIAQGEAPPYGHLMRIHHNPCFRYLSVNLFFRESEGYLDVR